MRHVHMLNVDGRGVAPQTLGLRNYPLIFFFWCAVRGAAHQAEEQGDSLHMQWPFSSVLRP